MPIGFESLGQAVLQLATDDTLFNKGMTKAELKAVALSKSFMTIGKKMTAAFTGPIVAIGGIAVKIGGDFEFAMKRVAAVTGATSAEFKQLSNTARELGATTQFSAQEAADAMQFLGMAGFDATKILAALPSVLNLAAAGATDLGTAADIVTNIMSGFGIEAGKVANAADVLTKTFTSSNTTIQELGEAFSYAGPIAKAAGIQFNEIAAVFGELGNAGIKATRAGTAVRSIISSLISPTESAANAMQRLKLNVLDSSGNMRSFTDIVQQLEKSGATAADMMEIFGLRAGPAMQALVSQGSSALIGLTGKLNNAGGTASRIATQMMDSFKGGWLELKSAVSEFFITLATEGGILDDVRGLMQGITEKIRGLTTAIKGMSPEARKMLKTIALVVAGIGPALIAFGLLVKGLATVGRSFRIAGGLIKSPWLVLVGVIAGGAYLIIRHWDDIKNATQKNWSQIKDFTKQLWSSLKLIFGNLKDNVVLEVRSMLNQVGGFFLDKFERIAQAAKDFGSKIGQTIAASVNPKNWGGGKLNAAINEIWQDGLTNAFSADFDSKGNQMIEKGKQFAAEAVKNWGTVQAELDKLWGSFQETYTQIADRTAEVNAKAAADIKGLVSGIGGFFKNGAANFRDMMQSLKDASGKAGELAGGLNDAADSAGNLETTTGNVADNMHQAALAAAQLSGLRWNTAAGYYSGSSGSPGPSSESGSSSESGGGALSRMGSFLSSMLSKLWSFLQSFESFKNLIDSIVAALKAGLEPIVDLLVTALQPLVPIVQYLGEVLGKVLAPVFTAIGNILNTLTPLLYIIGDLLEIFGSIVAAFMPFLEMFAQIISAVLVPILQAFAPVLVFLANIVVAIANFFISIFNLFGAGLDKLNKVTMPTHDPVSPNTGSTTTGGRDRRPTSATEVGYGGGAATLEQQRPINVTIQVYDNELAGDDGFRQLAKIIRSEFVSMGVLNA